MVKIYSVNINYDMGHFLFYRLMEFLSQEKQRRIIKFHNFKDAQRTLIADILVRLIICDSLGIKNEDIIFDKNEYGKPFLKHFDDFHYNISHAGEWVVCATHNMSVGIDIEHVKPIDVNIAKRFFAENEYNDLMSIHGSQRLSYFYDLWTLKESYIKTLGKGLSVPLDSFSFRLNNQIEFQTENELKVCFFRQYNIYEDYKMAACAKVNKFSDEIVAINCGDLCHKAIEVLNPVSDVLPLRGGGFLAPRPAQPPIFPSAD